MDNCLHYGTGTISISFDKSIATDSIDVTAITSSIFNDPFEEDIIHFTKKIITLLRARFHWRHKHP